MKKTGWIGDNKTAKNYEKKAHNSAVKFSEKYTAKEVAEIIWNRYGFLSTVKDNQVSFKSQFGILSTYTCK